MENQTTVMTPEDIALIVGTVGELSAPEAALLLVLGNEAKAKKFAEINVRVNDSVVVSGHVIRYLDAKILRKLSTAKTPEDVKA